MTAIAWAICYAATVWWLARANARVKTTVLIMAVAFFFGMVVTTALDLYPEGVQWL